MLTSSSALATYTAGQLNVLGHDGHEPAMHTAEIDLAHRLQCRDDQRLHRDLTPESLDRQLVAQWHRAYLIATGLPQQHRTRTVTVRLLGATVRKRTITRG